MKCLKAPGAAAVALLLASFAFPLFAAAEAKQAPVNVLLIVTDDQRWDELGLVQAEQGANARFSFLKTPRLDALAAEGMRFRNAFVTTSLCSPSRSSILTGKYNHTNGTIANHTRFEAQPTWATALQKAGYNTGYVGKWHHGSFWNRPGFDYIATYRGQGKYLDTTFKVNGEFVDTKGYIDERSVEYAIDFMRTERDKPFALMVGFKAVHQIYKPMVEHAENYVGAPIGPPVNWNTVPVWFNLKFPKLSRHRPYNSNWPRILPRFQTIDGIDANVGRLLDTLDELDLAKNTLVIFTSDNGYYLGEHRLADKRSAYEESIRVPLLVRLPEVIPAGSISDDMVLNIDLAPTLLDLVGQSVPKAMQGKTLRPLFAENAAPFRKSFLYEYWQDNEHWRKRHLPRNPTILAVRTATHKLITYPDFPKWTELFDLVNDPYETRNLVAYTAANERLLEMCGLLKEITAETQYNAKPSLNKWLIGITDSYVTAQAHAAQPVAENRPPMLQRNCSA